MFQTPEGSIIGNMWPRLLVSIDFELVKLIQNWGLMFYYLAVLVPLLMMNPSKLPAQFIRKIMKRNASINYFVKIMVAEVLYLQEALECPV